MLHTLSGAIARLLVASHSIRISDPLFSVRQRLLAGLEVAAHVGHPLAGQPRQQRDVAHSPQRRHGERRGRAIERNRGAPGKRRMSRSDTPTTTDTLVTSSFVRVLPVSRLLSLLCRALLAERLAS